ncbi:MAG: 2'-5' RNA ligase family protein [bacterium]|nr:2'-5' RNA ligase family protein [bacterium]
MYLVSIYFDKTTDQRIYNYIETVAMKSGNHLMIEGKVPPHITISSFETKNEREAIHCLQEGICKLKQGRIQMVSVGAFPSNALFVAPVVNEYLHSISDLVFETISKVDQVKISRYYQPFQWMPHLTIAKKLTDKEMMAAFQELQSQFQMFSAQVTKIGLAKTNPYRDIVSWELSE